MAVKLKAGLDAQGYPQALQAHVAGRAADSRPPYTPHVAATTTMGLLDGPYVAGIVPHTRVVNHALPIPIRSGAYRGPFYNSNCFFVESFIDECAHAAGIDEVEYRVNLLQKWPDPGWVAVVKEAAKQSGWG